MANHTPHGFDGRSRILGIAASVAVLLFLTLTLAACGSGGSSTSGSTSSGQGGNAAAAAPVSSTTSGGTLKWGGSLLPTSWDPVHSSAGLDAIAYNLVYTGLTALDEKGEAIPSLATSWKYVDNGSSLEFDLRKGVKFTDGAPFESQAVKANLERNAGPEALNGAQLATIKAVVPEGQYKVKLELTRPDYGLALRLAGIAGIMVSPKAFASNAAALANKPVGAGPYELKSYAPGSSAQLVRNPGYWASQEYPVEEVDLQQILDPQALLSSVQSGQIDVATISGTSTTAAESAGLTVQEVPSLVVGNIEINSTIAPFTDHRVVEAVNYALNREAILQTYNGGIGEVTTQPFPPGYVAYSKADANKYAYDPQKAKQIVGEVGGSISFPITYIPEAPPSQTVAEQMQAELKSVGIDAELKPLSADQWTEHAYVKHDLAFTSGFNLGRESPVQTLEVQFGPEGLLNPCRCSTPQLEAAIAAAGKIPVEDPSYGPTLEKATSLALEESANTFLFTLPRTFAYDPSKVSGWPNYLVSPQIVGVSVN